MSITTFDTLKYVRRLEQAGMSPELAEIQAEVLTEAFKVNLENLVTKDYLTAQLSALESRIEAKMDARFAAVDVRFAEMKADFDSKFRTLYVMFSIIMAPVIFPYLERLLAL